jgi:hypothetical protein
MSDTVKIAVLDSLFEAQSLEAALKERRIPCVIRSYEDLVLDGLFRGSKGWGHVEADEEDRPAVLAVLEDLRAAGDPGDPPA